MILNVGELIDVLGHLPKDLSLYMAIDAEGNGFGRVDGIEEGKNFAVIFPAHEYIDLYEEDYGCEEVTFHTFGEVG